MMMRIQTQIDTVILSSRGVAALFVAFGVRDHFPLMLCPPKGTS